MSYITGQEYFNLTEDFTEIVQNLSGISTLLYDQVYRIVLFQSVSPEVDLLTAFYGSYQLNSGITQTTNTYLSSVRALQQHILTRQTIYTSVNSYIYNEIIATNISPTGVSIEFATLSSDAGYPLNNGPYNVIGTF